MKNRKIKTIVVEDEVLLMRNIEKKIKQTDEAFEVIGCAYDGAEALKLIEENIPDVVFTDIRMPIMDGLRLTEILKDKYPQIYVVIVSGYDDFEYARKAIIYGVSNYLLKPVRVEELKETLEKLRKKIVVRSSEKAYALMAAGLHQKNMPELDRELCQYFEKKTFGIFLVSVGNLRLRTKSREENNTPDTWKKILRNEQLQKYESYVLEEGTNQCILIIENCENLQEIAHYLKRAGQTEFLTEMVNIAYRPECVSWNKLQESLKILRKHLHENLKIGHGGIFPDDISQKEYPPAVLSSVLQNHLQTLLNSGNISGMEKLIRQTAQQWEKEECSQQWIEKMLHQILILFQQNLFFSEEDYNQMFQNVFETLETGQDFQKSITGIVNELTGWLRRNQTVPSEIEEAIEQMNQYIHKHYTETINLAELAGKYHFNHSYMTRLFKKLKGQAPIKLINSLRMADAREMLKNEALSVKEISEALGFTDQHYFSRIFKETTGMTPKEYRSSDQ